MKNLTSLRISSFALALAFLAFSASGCVILADDDSSLTIANESSYVFVDIAVRSSGEVDFGSNLLRSSPLFPGEQVTVLLSCDTYDVFIEDDAQGQCELNGLSLCFDDAVWVVDNRELDSCVFGSATGPKIQDDVKPANRVINAALVDSSL